MAKTVLKNGNPAGTGRAIAPEERRRMIAETAYFRAQRRGFKGGDSVEDWLVAEREIDQMLLHVPQRMQQRPALALPGRTLGRPSTTTP